MPENESTRANDLLARLPAGAAAGALLALLDAGRALAHGATLVTILALSVLCIAAGVFLALAGATGSALARSLHARAPRLPVTALEGTFLALAAVPFARELFSGPGVRDTWLGTLGPFLLPAGVLGGAIAALTALRAAARASRALRSSAAVLLGALAALALTLDALWLRHLYASLHVVLVLCALSALALLLALVRPPQRSDKTAGSVLLALASLALVPVVIGFPHDNAARTLLLEAQPSAERLMTALSFAVDFDRDHSSPLFAGGDCNDFDAAVSPLQPEVPDNEIDEDCDGKDAAKGSVRIGYRAETRDRAARFRAGAITRPTVVLLIDSLRADRVGRPELPSLQTLAREALWFGNAYAPASSTRLSVPAMITGEAFPGSQHKSAFERLREQGVRTGLVAPDIVIETVTGEAGTASGTVHYPFVRGFERVVAIESGRGEDDQWGGGVTRKSAAAVTDAALALLDEGVSALWVHYFDLHQWELLDGVQATGYARYDAILRELDSQVGRFLGRADTPNVILTSDHGEGLGDSGIDYHTRFLWASLVRVPLLMRIHGLAPGRIDTPVSVTDLAPTLLDLYGRASAREAQFSLFGLVDHPGPSRAQLLSIESRHIALLEGRHRLIFDLQSRAGWLYEIDRDREERHNVIEKYPERANNMLQTLLLLRAAAQHRHDAAP